MNLAKIKDSPSLISLIFVNLIPVYGVLCLHWELFYILFLYWLESAIVGFFTILKIIKAEGKGPSNFQINNESAKQYSKGFVVCFFIIHYGIFMAAHGVFIFVLFKPKVFYPQDVLLAFIFLFISHGISYIFNFLGKGEYKETSFTQQMMQPYGRILVMHITVILAGFAIVKFSIAGPIALVVMVMLKTGIDLGAHLAEHKKFQASFNKVS
jgi:hypothetical protein